MLMGRTWPRDAYETTATEELTSVSLALSFSLFVCLYFLFSQSNQIQYNIILYIFYFF